MSGFTEQLALLKSGDNDNVFPTTSWTLQDYKDMMECVGKLEIIQNMGEDRSIPPEAFILNPDYAETEEIEHFRCKTKEVLCGGCGNNDMYKYYKYPCEYDRCSDCESQDEEEEEEE